MAQLESILPMNIIMINGELRDGFTAIQTMDLDGKLDIIVFHQTRSTLIYIYIDKNNQHFVLKK